MDLMIYLHGNKDVFIGGFPDKLSEYPTRCILCMGTSVTAMARNRRFGIERRVQLRSKTGPRQWKELSPVSLMFKPRFCHGAGLAFLSEAEAQVILDKYFSIVDDEHGDDSQ